jgi:small conductance mechanosensitive channel
VTRKRILELTSKAAGADEAEAKRLQAEIASLEGRLGEQVLSLQQIADLMEARGLATAEHRGLLIETTGEITTDILSQEVALGLVDRWGTEAKRWFVARAPKLAFTAALAVALLLGAHLAGRLLQRVAKRGLQSARVPVSQLFQSFVLTMTYRIALGLGALVVLSQLGVAIAPLLAGLGFVSFIVGFALQDTLSNFAAGMLILAYRPFDVGDEVTAGGVYGNVQQMTLVTTTILTLDHQRLIVPNSKIWGDVITNHTAERMRRVDLTFGIDYSDDVEHAEKVLHDIVRNHEKVLKDPAPVIKLHSLGEISVNFTVRPWAQTVDYWDVYWDITREVKRRFDAEGISIPLRQRDVHPSQPEGNAGNEAQASSRGEGSS